MPPLPGCTHLIWINPYIFPDYGSFIIWIWSVIRICNRNNFGHDRLKMGEKIQYSYTDKFSSDILCCRLRWPTRCWARTCLISSTTWSSPRSTITPPSRQTTGSTLVFLDIIISLLFIQFNFCICKKYGFRSSKIADSNTWGNKRLKENNGNKSLYDT